MNFDLIAAIFFGALALGLGGFAALCKSEFSAICAASAAIVATSGLHFLLGAEFVGAVQILLGAGVFVVALCTGQWRAARQAKPSKTTLIAALCAATLLVCLLLGGLLASTLAPSEPAPSDFDNITIVGISLFTEYLLLFELLSVALLLLCIVVCARHGKNSRAKMDANSQEISPANLSENLGENSQISPPNLPRDPAAKEFA